MHLWCAFEIMDMETCRCAFEIMDTITCRRAFEIMDKAPALVSSIAGTKQPIDATFEIMAKVPAVVRSIPVTW